MREEGDGFLARVTSPFALRSSPDQGVKKFVAETESLAREAAETWVDEMEGHSEDDQQVQA